jgi:hypothetical protein
LKRVRKRIKILFFISLGILVVSCIFLVGGLYIGGPSGLPPPPSPSIPPTPALPEPITPAYVWLPAIGALVGGIGSLISGIVALIVVLRKSRT